MVNPIRTIKVTLIGYYWDLVPTYSIHCNDQFICRKEIPTGTGIPHQEEFIYDGDATSLLLRIELLNKSSDQTVLNLNGDKLIRDMLLEVNTLSVDGRDIPVWDGIYKLKQKQIYYGKLVKEIPQANTMGWNGVLEFNIPLL